MSTIVMYTDRKKYISLYLKHRMNIERGNRLFNDLDYEKFKNFYRVSREQFQELLPFLDVHGTDRGSKAQVTETR